MRLRAVLQGRESEATNRGTYYLVTTKRSARDKTDDEIGPRGRRFGESVAVEALDDDDKTRSVSVVQVEGNRAMGWSSAGRSVEKGGV